MRHPPTTVERAFELANDIEKQLQVADSFKLDFPNIPPENINEMSAEETSGDEQEVNEIARGKRWGNNSGNYNQKHSNFNNNHNSSYKQQQQQPRKTDKSNSGHKNQRLKENLDSGV